MVERTGTDWNTAATYQEMDRQDEACRREAQMLEQFPLEMFEVPAWEHAFDESGYELLLHIAERSPVSMLIALCVFAGIRAPITLAPQSQRAQVVMRNDIEHWIRAEQERLQAARIEQEL